MNEARPSAVLSTDLQLDKDQVQALRDRWNDQAKGLHQGGTPILTAGLKVQPWAQGGKDAATAEMLKLSNEHIALAFRIPLQILGLGGTNYASTELLMQSWVASGLGFALNHIEEAIGLLFGAEGPARRIRRVRHGGAAALGPEGPDRGAGARRSGRHLRAQ